MNYASSWDFTLANYDAVWGFMVQLGLLLLFLMMGNILRRVVPLFRKCLIPSALLGGTLLLLVNIIGKQFGFEGNLAPCASWKLLKAAHDKAAEMGVNMPVGPVYSSDCFYDESAPLGKLQKLGVLCVEMESYALYLNAARAGKNALALLTISDNPFTGEGLDSEQRQNTFTQMMEIALEIA